MKGSFAVPVATGLVVFVAACGGDTTTIINQAPSTTPAQQQTGSSAPGAPQQGSAASCGQVDFSGTPTTIVVLRGTACNEAVRVATAYAASTPPHPWQCGLAHAPYDSYPLPDDRSAIIGFSCG